MPRELCMRFCTHEKSSSVATTGRARCIARNGFRPTLAKCLRHHETIQGSYRFAKIALPRARAAFHMCECGSQSSDKPKRADGESHMFVTVASRGALHTLDALRDRLLAATER